jgi:RNA polymerase sigma-70 factor (ECF subfamily)
MLAYAVPSAPEPVCPGRGKIMKAQEDLAFTRLFTDYRGKVYNQVYGMTRSAWHAEEMVQEVFMRVWIHRDKLAGIKDMNSWLFIITKRLAFDYFVKLSKERTTLKNFPRRGNADSSDAFFTRKCEQLLNEATQRLTPRLQEAFVLKYYKHCKKAEVARIMNISEYTAIHHIKKSAFLVRQYVLDKLEIAA